jgi:hypothetical protein
MISFCAAVACSVERATTRCHRTPRPFAANVEGAARQRSRFTNASSSFAWSSRSKASESTRERLNISRWGSSRVTVRISSTRFGSPVPGSTPLTDTSGNRASTTPELSCAIDVSDRAMGINLDFRLFGCMTGTIRVRSMANTRRAACTSRHWLFAATKAPGASTSVKSAREIPMPSRRISEGREGLCQLTRRSTSKVPMFPQPSTKADVGQRVPAARPSTSVRALSVSGVGGTGRSHRLETHSHPEMHARVAFTGHATSRFRTNCAIPK